MLEDIIRIPIFSQIAVFVLQVAIFLYGIELVGIFDSNPRSQAESGQILLVRM